MTSNIPTTEQIISFHNILKTILQSDNASISPKIATLIDSTPLLATLPNPATGTTPLILSSTSPLYTKYFLTSGAPWNALDKTSRCSGNHASDAGAQEVVDILVDHATRCEMLLSQAIINNGMRNVVPSVVDTGEDEGVGGKKCTKGEYLETRVRYEGDNLLDKDNDAVMMEWERPLMSEHANIITETGKRVLNVGFGMGIIDGILQDKGISHHTIIEAHPDVYAKMKKDGWVDKPNVTVLFGRWQDVIPQVPDGAIDGAFFDTYAENHTDLTEFHSHLSRILSPSGVYSFFNGLCPDNIFFHGVACNVVKLELEGMGFEVDFVGAEIKVDGKAWEGVRRKYWHFDYYYFPVCRRRAVEGGNGEVKGEEQPNKKQKTEE